MQKKIPMRKCVGCGEMKEKKELIRVLKTPEDEILLEANKWELTHGGMCNNADCLKKAVKNKGLERSLKSHIPAEVLERMEKELG